VTNGEFLEFVDDGGYREPAVALRRLGAVREGWRAPLYWERDGDGAWRTFTLGGLRELDPDEPVCT
jgi:formylglycine-generating enzyme required for sulfatase activity